MLAKNDGSFCRDGGDSRCRTKTPCAPVSGTTFDEAIFDSLVFELETPADVAAIARCTLIREAGGGSFKIDWPENSIATDMVKLEHYAELVERYYEAHA